MNQSKISEMRINKFLFLKKSLIVAFCVALVACSSEGGDNQSEEITDETQTEEAMDEGTAHYNLPSPLQIAQIFKRSGLIYLEGIVSSERQPSKYTSNASKALNLGIYSADLGYCVVNKQSQEALDLMKLSRELADALGMLSVFDENRFAERFEANLGNEDSLIYIIADLQMESDFYLEENELKHISAIAFAGAWIESLYIGSQVAKQKDDVNISDKISEQMSILDKIVKVLGAYRDKDAAVAGIEADLKSVEDIYNAIPAVKNYDEENAEEPLKLNDEDISGISSKIAELRAKYIQGNI